MRESHDVEAILRKTFHAASVQAVSGNGWKYFLVTSYPTANDRRKSVTIKLTFHSLPDGGRKLSANARFANMPELTQDNFAEMWKAKRLTTFRAPHLPAGLQTQDYIVDGLKPGIITITVNDKNALDSLIFEEK
ncbi:hypothetical protein [Pseudoduganella chitinolytica]|uniref:Uncharacterized protein n=1 Tax=Pseudoduganella chitinolytica TaxID=34070 RepID=A0ABY8B5Z3_9BURK|nr:hypothetical protein [Pseudoduganella chitinolytica]WEF31225.1 hypothetical protein PX653_17355 [Pseudoduganella chitinolytica]